MSSPATSWARASEADCHAFAYESTAAGSLPARACRFPAESASFAGPSNAAVPPCACAMPSCARPRSAARISSTAVLPLLRDSPARRWRSLTASREAMKTFLPYGGASASRPLIQSPGAVARASAATAALAGAALALACGASACTWRRACRSASLGAGAAAAVAAEPNSTAQEDHDASTARRADMADSDHGWWRRRLEGQLAKDGRSGSPHAARLADTAGATLGDAADRGREQVGQAVHADARSRL